MTTESFIFFTSWLEAIEELDEAEQLPALKSILRYQAYHEEPKISGAAKAVFRMVKPMADTMYSRRMASQENGKKGGRPKSTKSGEEPEDKVTEGNLEKPSNNLKKPKRNLNEYVYVNGNGYCKKSLYDIQPKYDSSKNRKMSKEEEEELLSLMGSTGIIYDPSRNKKIPEEKKQEILKRMKQI